MNIDRDQTDILCDKPADMVGAIRPRIEDGIDYLAGLGYVFLELSLNPNL